MKTEAAPTRGPLRWMTMLTAFTAVLVTAEFVVGYHAHSLALIGDAGHMLLDLVGYATAIVCELLKSTAQHHRRTVAAIDLFVCLFSIVLIAGGMTWVWEAAMHRMLGGEHPDHGVHENGAMRAAGFEIVWKDLFQGHSKETGGADADGKLMFVFALCSVVVNASLGMTGYYFVNQSHGTWADWLHAVLHPGCAGTGCSGSHARSPDSNQGGDGVIQDDGAAEQKQEAASINLNVVVIWIHVMTDALKDLVIIAVSLLMMMNLVAPRTADAASAIVVICLVLVGSVWILPAMYVRARQVFFDGFDDLEISNLRSEDPERRPLVAEGCEASHTLCFGKTCCQEANGITSDWRRHGQSNDTL